VIKDFGRMEPEEDEQITFIKKTKGEYDFKS
jgi:hypothetical protein